MRILLLLLPFSVILGCASTGSKDTRLAQSPKPSMQFDQELSLARLSERHGDVADAESTYQKILEKAPQTQMAHHRLGVIAAQRGEMDRAMEHFARAEKIGPVSAQLLNDIGYAHYLQNNLSEAEARTRQAIRLDSGFKAAHNNLGQILAEQGNFEASLAEFRQAAGDAEAYANLAYVQVRMGRFEEATANCHRALELDKGMRTAANILVQIHGQQDRGLVASTPRPLPAVSQTQSPTQATAPGMNVVQASAVSEPTFSAPVTAPEEPSVVASRLPEPLTSRIPVTHPAPSGVTQVMAIEASPVHYAVTPASITEPEPTVRPLSQPTPHKRPSLFGNLSTQPSQD
jgi:Tfp pilus assembly protein PilF